MHLKSYAIDGRLLRTGAANFSASGEKRQDNDLIVIESAEAAATFKRAFDARFAGGNTQTDVGMGRCLMIQIRFSPETCSTRR